MKTLKLPIILFCLLILAVKGDGQLSPALPPTSGATTERSSCAADYTNGIVGWYLVGQNASDNSGNGNTLSLTSSGGFPGYSSHAGTCAASGSMTFNNANEAYADTGQVAAFDLLTYSVSFWINLSAFTPAYSATYQLFSGSQYAAAFVNSNAKLAYYISTTTSTGDYDGTGSHTLSSSTWYYIYVDYNAITGVGSAYVNTNFDGAFTNTPGNLFSSTTTVMLGADAGFTGRCPSGQISQVRFRSSTLTVQQQQAEFLANQ